MVITTSGTIATFKTKTPKEIKSLKVYFGPIQEGSGDPSPTNVRPISGRTGLEVIACGRNLFDPGWYINTSATTNGLTYTMQSDGSIIVNGTTPSASQASKAFNIGRNSIPPGNYYATVGPYTVKKDDKDYSSHYLWNSTAGAIAKKWDGTTNMSFYSTGRSYAEVQLWKGYSYSFGIRYYKDNVVENELSYPSIIVPIDNPSNIVYEPYCGRNLLIDWTSEAGTIYGGYVDLISGELVVTHKSKTYIGASTEDWKAEEFASDRYYIVLNDVEIIQFNQRTEIISNIGLFSSSGGDNYTIFAYQYNNTYNKALYYYPPSSALGNIDTFKSWLSENNLQIIYKLDNPITYQLTPQQLSTLVGRNNIWGIDCDTTEVSYDFEDLLDMTKTRQKILRACQVYKTKLPPGYIEYDWLEGVGSSNSRIDTGVPGNDTTLQIDCTFMPIALNSNSYYGVFGNYVNENDSYCWRIILQANTSSNFNCGFYVTMGNNSPGGGGTEALYPTNNAAPMEGIKCNVIMTYGEATMYAARTHHVTRPFATKNENATHICIGGSRVSSTGGKAVFRYYNFKFSSQGKLIRDYRPCVRIKDNKAGFYDMVNYTFNPSIGSVDFVAGNDT